MREGHVCGSIPYYLHEKYCVCYKKGDSLLKIYCHECRVDSKALCHQGELYHEEVARFFSNSLVQVTMYTTILYG